mmetsp:Transcript_10771/g.15603  ORF Transcript_10771/g.15603 Transcript_10771/m.15603 type:complete len:95 (+) Transcript_10771:1-285(+)
MLSFACQAMTKELHIIFPTKKLPYMHPSLKCYEHKHGTLQTRSTDEHGRGHVVWKQFEHFFLDYADAGSEEELLLGHSQIRRKRNDGCELLCRR